MNRFIANAGVRVSSDRDNMKIYAKEEILKLAKTPEDAEKIVQYLLSLNWKEVFEERKRKENSYREEAFARGGGFCKYCKQLSYGVLTPVEFSQDIRGNFCYSCISALQKRYDIDFARCFYPCDECHKPIQGQSLQNHPAIAKREKGYCSTCLQKKIEAQRITCLVCGKETIVHTAKDVCDECYRKYPDASIVMSHKYRAITLGLPSTLTFEEWNDTVEYFQHRCAYCNKPYTALEHFLPLTKGGGTTADNCVPSCQKCNSRKGDKLPNQFDRLFPTDNLARIRTYLETQKNEENGLQRKG